MHVDVEEPVASFEGIEGARLVRGFVDSREGEALGE